MGCAVVRSRDITISQNPNIISFLDENRRTSSTTDSGLTTQEFPSHIKCWVVIPILERRPYSKHELNYLRRFYGNFVLPQSVLLPTELLETYMTIQNVTGITGSNITISNLITGIEKRFVRSLLASTKKVALN